MKIIQKSILLVVSTYLLLSILSFVFVASVEKDFLGMWGLIVGFMMLLTVTPFHKIVYFGGRGAAGTFTPQIPPDEHIHHKIHKQYENDERWKIGRQLQDILIISGIIIIVIAVVLL